MVISRAQFTPMPLHPDSFNADVIVEKSARTPLMPSTTASMDTGTTNTGYAWFEKGYNPTWPTAGLPPAGALITSEVGAYHDYRMPPTYKTNNVLLIDNVLTNGTLNFVTAAAYKKLSFLVSGGNFGGSIGFKVHYRDGGSEIGVCPCPNWLDTLYPACTTYGRVEVNAFTFADLGNQRLGFFYKDFELNYLGSEVVGVEFNFLGGESHNVVLAISAAENSSASFNPVEVSGYNADLVVEADAPRRAVLLGVTSATTDTGQLNNSWAWYEQGYYSPKPTSGLPGPGTSITPANLPDHVYQLPPSYSAGNAVLIDGLCPTATITPRTPVACGALSLLGTAGHGPASVGVLVQHADGSVETNNVSLPDWAAGSSASGALEVQGRVALLSGQVQPDAASYLAGIDFPLTNTGSPVLAITFYWGINPPGTHVVVLAISAANKIQESGPRLTLIPLSDGSLRLRTSRAGELQSTTDLRGNSTNWKGEGSISAELTLRPGTAEHAKFFRVRAN